MNTDLGQIFAGTEAKILALIDSRIDEKISNAKKQMN